MKQEVHAWETEKYINILPMIYDRIKDLTLIE
jgi:hypothetical protein